MPRVSDLPVELPSGHTSFTGEDPTVTTSGQSFVESLLGIVDGNRSAIVSCAEVILIVAALVILYTIVRDLSAFKPPPVRVIKRNSSDKKRY